LPCLGMRLHFDRRIVGDGRDRPSVIGEGKTRMEFFFVEEQSVVNFTDKKNLSVNFKLEAPENQNTNALPADKIYFATPFVLQMVTDSLKQLKNRKIINFFKGRENIYPQFLAKKDIWKNAEKISLPESLKIALIFDIRPTFADDFRQSAVEGLNYFYEKLVNHFNDVQIDIFTIYLSEWLDLAVKAPLTNLFPMPNTLDRLAFYDVFINFSNLLDEKKLVGKAALDICLKKLGLNFEQSPAGEEISYSYPSPLTFHLSPDDLVSVIIPTYNRENYLAMAVVSVLSQTYKNIELIIVDDGSTVDNRSVLEKFSGDNRIRYIYQENKGISSARNTGIINARGKYLMMLDDDDLYLPFAVEKLLTFIKRQPENVKLVYGDSLYFNDKKMYHIEPKLNSKPELFFQLMAENIFTTPGEAIMETQAVIDAGLFDLNYVSAEDYEFLTRMVCKYDIAKIDIPVTFYRKHEEQTTRNQGKIRYFSDLAAFKFLYLLKTNMLNIFELSWTKEIIAAKFDSTAINALNYCFTHYDTAFELLKLAQENKFEKDRQEYMNYLSKNINSLIRKNFDSDLRISEAEKELLRQPFIATKNRN
jgi:glycosyltransferase involved in cell wall biosynthesis